MALEERHAEEFRRQRFCAGIVAAEVKNWAMTREKDTPWATALDFVPEWSKEKQPQTEEEMIASMAAFFGCGPGKPN